MHPSFQNHGDFLSTGPKPGHAARYVHCTFSRRLLISIQTIRRRWKSGFSIPPYAAVRINASRLDRSPSDRIHHAIGCPRSSAEQLFVSLADATERAASVPGAGRTWTDPSDGLCDSKAQWHEYPREIRASSCSLSSDGGSRAVLYECAVGWTGRVGIQYEDG
jgi:hypothetical protein